jgi:hypothetical protein
MPRHIRSLGLAAVIAACAAAASATTITYDFRAVGWGYTVPGGSFGRTPFEIRVTGDSSTFFEDPGVAHGAFAETGRIYGDGGSSELKIVAPTGFLVLEGAQAGELAVGADIGGVVLTNHLLSAPQFATWDGISPLGPIPVSILEFGYIELNLGAGPDLYFTRLEDATFSASVPEPAEWAMLLLGFGGLGLALRGRCATGVRL